MVLNFNELKLNNKDPVYIQIVLYVKEQILLGDTKTGDELPSRRELAAHLGINPNTVQKAYRVMEQEGFLRTNGNQGSTLFINESIVYMIEEELTTEMVKDFVSSAKKIQLSFRKTIELITNIWEDI